MNTYIEQLIGILNRVAIYDKSHMAFPDYSAGMQAMINKFLEIREQQGCVFFVGNGGSAAIASHMTVDFMKNGRMRTCSLMVSSVLTCMGNDYGYEDIYAKQLEGLGKAGDILVAVSSSGNSANICHAIKTAQDKGMAVFTFSGFRSDNKLLRTGDCKVYVPVEKYGFVETIHNLMLQQIVDELSELET